MRIIIHSSLNPKNQKTKRKESDTIRTLASLPFLFGFPNHFRAYTIVGMPALHLHFHRSLIAVEVLLNCPFHGSTNDHLKAKLGLLKD